MHQLEEGEVAESKIRYILFDAFSKTTDTERCLMKMLSEWNNKHPALSYTGSVISFTKLLVKCFIELASENEIITKHLSIANKVKNDLERDMYARLEEKQSKIQRLKEDLKEADKRINYIMISRERIIANIKANHRAAFDRISNYHAADMRKKNIELNKLKVKIHAKNKRLANSISKRKRK